MLLLLRAYSPLPVRQADHQAWTGSAEGPPFDVRKKDHSEIIFAGLQVDRGQVANVSLDKDPFHFCELKY